jgi:hypothetical protein
MEHRLHQFAWISLWVALFKEARRIFLAHKKDERAPQIQGRCGELSEVCRRERSPGHTHGLIRREQNVPHFNSGAPRPPHRKD